MVNLFFTYTERGPGKEVKNLINGLNKINIEYSKNPTILKDKDYKIFLQGHNLMKTSSILEEAIIGPNICTLPIDNNIVMEQQYKKILVPSEWVKNKYKRWISAIWPVGVDVEKFEDYSNKEKDIDFLIYFKRRDEEDLNYVTNMLIKLGHTFQIIKYGTYKEIEFIQMMKKAKFAFIIDNCESQGLAIQEIMSCNLPLFVWNVKIWKDRGEKYEVPATSIPYWSNICGEVIYKKDEIEEKLYLFLKDFKNYNPRKYILENLTLEKQAKEIIKILTK